MYSLVLHPARLIRRWRHSSSYPLVKLLSFRTCRKLVQVCVHELRNIAADAAPMCQAEILYPKRFSEEAKGDRFVGANKPINKHIYIYIYRDR